MILRFSSPFRLAWAGIKLFWARLRGFRTLTTPWEAECRLNICHQCPELTESGQCRVCACFVESKTLLAPENCPLGKWKAIWVAKRAA